jgi:hypothetical protein
MIGHEQTTVSVQPKPTMLTESHGQLCVVWHGRETPTEAEWESHLREMRKLRSRPLKVLVMSEGGAPSPSQQLRLTPIISSPSVVIAVVSDTIGVRLVVSSLALFTRRIRTFRRGELALAHVHLGLDADETRFANAFARRVNALT